MTIGEKIKYHRTKLGLSQEELGQKLLVSRQTISLWENDQTAPTIDNLIRLKDILGVSIDNILNCENDEKINASPIESYTFKYTRDELTTLANISSYNRFKKLIWPIFLGFILFIIFCINSFQGESDYNFFTGIILSFLILIVYGHITNKKNSLKNIPLVCSREYHLKVYEKYFSIEIYKEQELLYAYTIKYSELVSVVDMPQLYLLNSINHSFIIRKSDLKDSSVLIQAILNNKIKLVLENPINKTDIFSIVLFISSAISALIGHLLVTAFSKASESGFQHGWIFFVLAIVPITSLIFGIIFKKKNKDCAKNIIIGIIATALLFTWGGVCILGNAIVDKSTDVIAKIEADANVDIPVSNGIEIKYYNESDQTVSGVNFIYDSRISFEQKNLNEFEEDIKHDYQWLTTIPEYLQVITKPLGNISGYTNILIYNYTDNTLNRPPSDSGTYHFLVLLYDKNNNFMRATEYKLDYTK